MPKITFAKKEVNSNDSTDIVWNAYQSAIKDSMVIAKAMAPDEKTVTTNLEVEEKKNIAGFYYSALRFTGLSHAASYSLDEQLVTVSQWADVFYKKLQSSLLKELTNAVYGDTELNKIGDTTSIMSVTTIDNHFMLICEIILRMVADALDEQLIKNRTRVLLGQDDSAVICLKRFVTNLKSDPEKIIKLFGKPPGSKTKISSMVRFLNVFFNRETSFINMLIFNARDVDAPKQSFELVSSALEIIQKNVRAYLLVYLDLLSQEVDKKSLLRNNDNLRSEIVLPFFGHAIEALLVQCNDGFLNEEDTDLMEIRKTVFLEDDIKILHMFTKKAQKLKDAQKKVSAIHSINEIKQLFILDEQLLAIRDAVREFVSFAELGNWIPIFFEVIHPEILSIAIGKFSKRCQAATLRYTGYLNNSDFIAGLESLPPFEWSKLDAMNIVIRNLNSQEMKERICDNFNTQINGLIRVEQLLFSHKLLDSDQHIISKLTAPQLTQSGPLLKAASASSQRRLTYESNESQEKVVELTAAASFNGRSHSWNTERDLRFNRGMQTHSSASHIAPSSALFTPQTPVAEVSESPSSSEKSEEKNTPERKQPEPTPRWYRRFCC
ncbi:MAG: hypothetical protein V4501_08385 [Pseudomonadota bacterium]